MGEELAELLKRCLSDDDEALTSLVSRFQPMALDLARALLEDRDLSEDVVQEAFITAMQRLPDLRRADAFAPWLRQIVRTHVNRVHRKKRELSLSEDAEPVFGDLSVGQQHERDELHCRARQALRNLPESARRTSELYYLNEFSCPEIANLLHTL